MILGDVQTEKVLVVEGASDRKKVRKILNEEVDILCTNGTISYQKMDSFVDELYDKDVYILTDSDESGDKLRKQFKREIPNARHLYIDRTYREVAAAPDYHIAAVLLGANFAIHTEYLYKG